MGQWLQSGFLDSLCGPQAAGHWSVSHDKFWEQAEGLASLRFTPTDDSEAGTELLKCLCCPRSAPPDVRQKQTNKQKIKPVQSPMSPLNFLALSHGIAPYSWRSLSSPLTCLPHQTVATEPGTSQAISCTSFPCNCKEGTYREVGLWSFSPLWRRDSRDPEQGVIFLSFSVGKKSSLEVPSGATLGLPELPF